MEIGFGIPFVYSFVGSIVGEVGIVVGVGVYFGVMIVCGNAVGVTLGMVGVVVGKAVAFGVSAMKVFGFTDTQPHTDIKRMLYSIRLSNPICFFIWVLHLPALHAGFLLLTPDL
jgi:hypothetical protein